MSFDRLFLIFSVIVCVGFCTAWAIENWVHRFINAYDRRTDALRKDRP